MNVNTKVLIVGMLLMVGVAICLDAAHVPNAHATVVAMAAAAVIVGVARMFATRRGK